ncbi:hypothetical protein RF11_08241 [Thelohanellus kitauei]|uniref:Serpin domain-containing protein n=1 Tax=Thelohanellus kitauei TaxID=669202 RepID=A0A0C2N206_THEKT|nr:hypothetical protein RF11_08241 [Thelohanellus kitauei]
MIKLRHGSISQNFEEFRCHLFIKHGADFSKMIMGDGYINDYIQVSTIMVNEIGSHATTPSNHYTSVRATSTTVLFNVSRPFIFYLYNSENNLMLHISVVTDPYL